MAEVTSTANDEGNGVARAEPLPVAAPSPPPLAETPADGVEDDGDTTMPGAPPASPASPPAWHKVAAQWKLMAEGKHTNRDAKKCFATVPDPQELAHPFLVRAIGQLNSGGRSKAWESLADAIDFEVSETDSQPKWQQRSEAVCVALKDVSAVDFLTAARASASATVKFAKDTHVEDVDDPTIRGVVLKNFRFVLQDDAVSLNARRVHQPFPAYASGLVADVQAVLNEVISAEGQYADVANESLRFFISRSLPAERPPGESRWAVRKRTAHLQTEPVTRRPSPHAPKRLDPADAHRQQQAASVKLTWDDECKAKVQSAVRAVCDRQDLDTVPGHAKSFWEAVAGELKLPLDKHSALSSGWKRHQLTLPPPPPVVQALAEPSHTEPMSVEAPGASVEPADGQGDDVAHDDAASGAALDAAGNSSDAKNEGADASDDRDAAEDDIAADLLMEEILGLLGPESESESPES